MVVPELGRKVRVGSIWPVELLQYLTISLAPHYPRALGSGIVGFLQCQTWLYVLQKLEDLPGFPC